MTDIILEQKGGEVRVDSRIIAKGLGQKSHHDFRRNILEKYEKSIKGLGVVLKTTLDSGAVAWYLNEDQIYFVGTLCRNNERVVAFKLALVSEFGKARNFLTQKQNQEYLEARSQGKIARRLETDVIKEFVDYATGQGSKSAKMYYVNISKMENKALFLVEQKYPNLRDILGTAELNTIQTCDRIVAKALKEGIANDMPYKDIYKFAKSRVENYAELVGQTKVSAPILSPA